MKTRAQRLKKWARDVAMMTRSEIQDFNHNHSAFAPEDGKKQQTDLEYACFIAIYLIQMSFAMLVCAWKGHQWVDESYGGPESGRVEIRCECCCESHRVILY
ncbi:hypothetical protein [Methylocaldum szegediense]|uniref:hypothetical protein n=1 Tax=Methylocaldum szegediense TaxID=73780 RepID=UPI000478F862|nr:hypothetical protein [Methylocaldum szegediense]